MPKTRIVTPRSDIAPTTLLIGDLASKVLSYAEHLDFLLSVRDARFATMFQFYLSYLWWIIAIAAAIWLLYEYKKRKENPNHPGSVGALIFSSATIAFILGVMVAVNATGSLPLVLQSYGSDGVAKICTATVDTSRLTGFEDDYRVMLICGAHDATVDADEDTRIAVSSLFHVNGQGINIDAPFGHLADFYKDVAFPNTPPGAQQGYSFAIWHTVVLVPKETNPHTITKVSDVARQGGRIITDPIGGYQSPAMVPK